MIVFALERVGRTYQARRKMSSLVLGKTVRNYHPPPPPPPPPPPEKPPPEEKPDDEELDFGAGIVEAIVEAMDDEKPPMRSPKCPMPWPTYQTGE